MPFRANMLSVSRRLSSVQHLSPAMGRETRMLAGNIRLQWGGDVMCLFPLSVIKGMKRLLCPTVLHFPQSYKWNGFSYPQVECKFSVFTKFTDEKGVSLPSYYSAR